MWFSKVEYAADLPIDFGFRVWNNNDHTVALATHKIANKAIGDVADTDCRRSKNIEFIFALTQYGCYLNNRLRGPQILYKLYAIIPINGISE